MRFAWPLSERAEQARDPEGTDYYAKHLSAHRLRRVYEIAPLDFADEQFDLVVCIQNGISAFKVAPVALMREALRATTASPAELRAWADQLGVHAAVQEVDGSSTFCELSRA